MTKVSIEPSYNDMIFSHGIYSTAWNASTGTIETATTNHRCGQNYISSTEFYLYRSAFRWNLSAYSGETLSSANMLLTGAGSSGIDTDFDFVMCEYTGGFPIDTNDYVYTKWGTTSYGSLNKDYYSADTDGIIIPFNSTGLSVLQSALGSTVDIGLRGSKELNAKQENIDSYFQYYPLAYTTDTSKRPHLYLEYGASTWTPKIMMIMKPLEDGFFDWIRKPLQKDMYLQI